jgi:hypothetical protein
MARRAVCSWLTLLSVMPFLTACGGAGPAAVDLEDLVVAFVASIPGRGSEAMTLPTAEEARQFVAGVRAARDGDPQRAADLVDPLDYGVRTVVDSITGRRLYLFEERRSDDGWPHGWGLYAIAAGSSRPLIVEVSHPLYDINTAPVGVQAFRRGDAGGLLVAGTHRYANDDGSSDVAHDDRTMFAAVNRALVSRRETVLQPHGFSDSGTGSDAGDLGDSDVVVSAGTAPPPPAVRAVTAALRRKGFAVCEYDGRRCADLGATTNVEGRWCREVGATFVHLELDRDVRDDRSRRTLAARTVVDALASLDDSRSDGSHQNR